MTVNIDDIGTMPTNFQNISHVGWDPNRGFDWENVDPNLKKFFHKAGVDKRVLQDKDTREFIYDFIDKHGGVEAAIREVNAQPEPLVASAPPPPDLALMSPAYSPLTFHLVSVAGRSGVLPEVVGRVIWILCVR